MKKILTLVLAVFISLSVFGCGSQQGSQNNIQETIDSDATVTTAGETIRWPSTELVNRLPKPESLVGELQWESTEDFCVDLYGVTQTQFDDYVDACMDCGFTVDYYRDSESFWAYDQEGYDLSIYYYEEETCMTISIDVPLDDTDTEEELEATTTTTTTTTVKPTTKVTTTKTTSTGISKEFKAAMDSYEKFMDDYVAFMKKYQANPSDLSLLMDYTEFMSDYAEVMEDFEAWEDEDLNDAELAYYLDVQARVSKKLLEVVQ